MVAKAIKAQLAAKTHLQDANFPERTLCGKLAKTVTLAAKTGTCQVCGCTDDKACSGGCSWWNRSHTICTACSVSSKGVSPPTCKWCSRWDLAGVAA